MVGKFEGLFGQNQDKCEARNTGMVIMKQNSRCFQPVKCYVLGNIHVMFKQRTKMMCKKTACKKTMASKFLGLVLCKFSSIVNQT